MRAHRSLKRLVAVTALVASGAAAVGLIRSAGERDVRSSVAPREEIAPRQTPPPRRRERRPRIVWHRSTALGSPSAGRLSRAVRLPARSEHFNTWDPVLKRTPNRWWRRNGTDGLVRVLVRVTDDFADAHPKAPRVLIGDLSRPHGGDFGRRFGPLGHVSHQNGLDADVYYPRVDRRERAPLRINQVDRALAQDLVNRFLRAGAQRIFVGARLSLRGPPGVVQPLPNHDNHLHVRFAPFTRR
jgi:murein endopeptidase